MQWEVDQVREDEIKGAVDRVNLQFDNNITIEDLKDCGLDVDLRGHWKFSLHVINIDGPGRRFDRPRSEWHIPQATKSICWDVRFLFFHELPDHALILVGNHWIARADNFYPVQYFRSAGRQYDLLECCDCERGVRYVLPQQKGRVINNARLAH